MKKISLKKVLFVTLMIFLLVNYIIPLATYAGDSWDSTTQFDNNSDADLDSDVRSVIGAILNVTRIIGTGIAIIMLIVVAMKYMMSAPGDRADIKKHAVVYVVGAVVLFGSAQIIGIISSFAQNLGN